MEGENGQKHWQERQAHSAYTGAGFNTFGASLEVLVDWYRGVDPDLYSRDRLVRVL